VQKEFWRHSSRDRYPGGSKEDEKTLRYLAIVAIKYKFDSAELLDHVTEAWKEEEARFGQVSIKCREKADDSAVFLFIIGEDVIAQFSIPIRVLKEKNHLEKYVKTLSASRNIRVAEPKVKDLKVGMKDISLKVEVLEVPKPNRVYTRNGTISHVSNVLVGDKTGTIRMSLWNEQINDISKGDVIEIKNGAVASFKGKLQLRIRRSGSLRVIKA
jgi:hypothetical protein